MRDSQTLKMEVTLSTVNMTTKISAKTGLLTQMLIITQLEVANIACCGTESIDPTTWPTSRMQIENETWTEPDKQIFYFFKTVLK